MKLVVVLFALIASSVVAQAAANRQQISVTPVVTSDSAWPEPGNPVPPYDK